MPKLKRWFFVHHIRVTCLVFPTFHDTEVVHNYKLLGVYLSDILSFEKHATQVLASCSKRFYLLKMLRDGGMPRAELSVIFCSLD
jgi:hypothetical protein